MIPTSTKERLRAIPTVYCGVEMKSRLEAQAAFLFDKLGWEWQYEPQSFMLPNGVAYTPDFVIPGSGVVVECRGYDTKKGRRQISGFAQLLVAGITFEEGHIGNFVVLYGDSEAATYRSFKDELRHTGMFAVIHCKECGWRIATVGTDTADGMGMFPMYCESCIAPMSLPSWSKWDGKTRIDRAAIITVEQGKILVNGVGVEDFIA